MLSLKVHNIIDYVAGIFLIASPWIFNFSTLETPRMVMVGTGVFVLAYSAFTNFPYALSRQIPAGANMMLDLLAGAFLIVAPWVFMYRDALTPGQEYLHYLLGIAFFTYVALTRSFRDPEKTTAGSYRHATTGRL